jgi:hypothetical protein
MRAPRGAGRSRIEVDDVRYSAASMADPNQMMVVSGAVDVRRIEAAAGGIGRGALVRSAALPKIPPPGSMAWRLIHERI